MIANSLLSRHQFLYFTSGLLLFLRINNYLHDQYINGVLSSESKDPDSFYGWYESYKASRDPKDFVLIKDSFGYYLFGSRILFWVLWSVTRNLSPITTTAIISAVLILTSAIITSKQLTTMGILPTPTAQFFVIILALYPSEEIYVPANLSYVLTLPLLGIILATVSLRDTSLSRLFLISLSAFLIISKPLSVLFSLIAMGLILIIKIVKHNLSWRQFITIASIAFVLLCHLLFAEFPQSVPEFDVFIAFRLLIFCGSIVFPVVSHSLDNLANQNNNLWVLTLGNLFFLILGLAILLLWYFANSRFRWSSNSQTNIDKSLGAIITIWSLILGIVTRPDFSPFALASHYFFSRQWYYSYFLIVVIILRTRMKSKSFLSIVMLNSIAYAILSLTI